MPFVVTRVNVPISPAQKLELKGRLGRAIEHVPGKSEAGLLLAFEGDCHLYLAGDGDTPLAYVEANVFANEGHAGYGRFAAEVTSALGEVLGIAPHHIYLCFSDIPVWSVGAQVIDRRMFR